MLVSACQGNDVKNMFTWPWPFKGSFFRIRWLAYVNVGCVRLQYIFLTANFYFIYSCFSCAILCSTIQRKYIYLVIAFVLVNCNDLYVTHVIMGALVAATAHHCLVFSKIYSPFYYSFHVWFLSLYIYLSFDLTYNPAGMFGFYTVASQVTVSLTFNTYYSSLYFLCVHDSFPSAVWTCC